MAVDELPEGLLERVSSAVDLIRGCPQVRVISHYDADGISSAGIVSSVLLREGINFQTTMVKSLEKDLIDGLANEDHECILLSDMGSGMLPELDSLDSKVVVLDHHKPPVDSEKVLHVNPHLYGIDGMTSSSASAVCMLFAITASEDNWDLLPMAFGGIAGDRQDIRGLSGLNAWLFERGESRGIVESKRRGLITSGPLGEMARRFDPYIKGISGSPKSTAKLLEGIGLSPETMGIELEDADRRKLQSILTLRLLEQGTDSTTLDELSGEIQFFPGWGMEAGEIASLLNACGRMGEEGTGLSLLLGDEDALERGRELRNGYIDDVLEALGEVEKNIEAMENIQFFRSNNPSLSGVVCGITMQYIADKTRPTIAIGEKGGKIRVSSRATFPLLERGVDLAEALRKGADEVGGAGGGHAIASGATLPLGKEKDFLKVVDALVGEQKAREA